MNTHDYPVGTCFIVANDIPVWALTPDERCLLMPEAIPFCEPLDSAEDRVCCEGECCSCDSPCCEDGVIGEFPDKIEIYHYNVLNPANIYRNGDYTTVEWEDGSKTTVKREPGRNDDPYVAFLWAFAKRMFGSTARVIEAANEADAQLKANARRIEKEKEKQERIRLHKEREEQLRKERDQRMDDRRAKLLHDLRPDEIELRAQERAAELLVNRRAMAILEEMEHEDAVEGAGE